MQHEGLKKLNDKAWYRLIKVLYFLALLVLIVSANMIMFSDGVSIDHDRTTVQCNLGSRKSLKASEIPVWFSNSDFKNGKLQYADYFKSFNDFNIQSIMKSCFPTRSGMDIYNSQKQAELLNTNNLIGSENSLTPEQKDLLAIPYNTYLQQTKNEPGIGKTAYLDFSFHMFDVDPSYKYGAFIFEVILGNVIILAIFEILRRAFYYVVLGKVNPK